MSLLKSCVVAFSMYSKIPMPQFQWKEENMRYSLLFFPFVGLIIGGGQFLLFWLLEMGDFPVGFGAAVATVLPVVITGGIHMDGYCDVLDALSSYQSKERRLEILKDSHVGAFAVLWTAAYFVLCYGGWYLVQQWLTVCMIGLGYVGSRVLSALAAVCFPSAKDTGTLYSFASVADRRLVRGGLICLFVVTVSLQFVIHQYIGLLLFVSEMIFYGYYYYMSKNRFGGINGDLEGWFLQCVELLILYVCGVGMFLVG